MKDFRGNTVTCPRCGAVNVKPIASNLSRDWWACRGTCGKDFKREG